MPIDMPLLIAPGNNKVGKVSTFSLPSLFTCPGSSGWCRKHCYAKRIERLRPQCLLAYSRNMVLSLDPERFTTHLLNTLPKDATYCRIHVGGDFYSEGYIQSWIDVCNDRPKTQFWSYTRSWNVSSLRSKIEELSCLPNIQLFASVDADMPLTQNNWRKAFIHTDSRASGILCRHQQGKVSNCLECGYCFDKTGGDVIFTIH